jgi:hypothetical protein
MAGGIFAYGSGSSARACLNTGAVSAGASGSYADGYGGGVCAYAFRDVDISDCHNTGLVSVSSEDDAYAGGICSSGSYGNISGCRNAGNVSAASAKDAYSGGIYSYDSYNGSGSYPGAITDCVVLSDSIVATSEGDGETRSYMIGGGPGVTKSNNGAKRGIFGNPVNDANYLIGGGSDNPGNGGNTGGSTGGGGSAAGGGTPAAGGTGSITSADGSVLITYTKSGGEATLSLPAAKIDEIVNKADDTAVLDASGSADIVTLTVDKTALGKLANAVPNIALRFPCGSITFDRTALSSILGAASYGSLSFGFAPVDLLTLPDAWRVSLTPEYSVFDIDLFSGTQSISAFSGVATVAVSYDGALPAGAWYLGDEGRERLKTSYDSVAGLLRFDLPNHLSLYAVGPDDEAAWENPFTDVSASDWFCGDVEYAVTKGLFAGVSNTRFAPERTTTRAMLVTVLGRLAGVEANAYAASGFEDVPEGAYYAGYVAWAAENGVALGTGEGRFSPDAAVTRQDLAALLLRYAESSGKQFPVTLQYVAFADEALIEDYAKAAAETLYRGGIVTGRPGGFFDPRGEATRAETAAMLHRFAERAR